MVGHFENRCAVCNCLCHGKRDKKCLRYYHWKGLKILFTVSQVRANNNFITMKMILLVRQWDSRCVVSRRERESWKKSESEEERDIWCDTDWIECRCAHHVNSNRQSFQHRTQFIERGKRNECKNPRNMDRYWYWYHFLYAFYFHYRIKFQMKKRTR